MKSKRFASARTKLRWAERSADEARRRASSYLQSEPITTTAVMHKRNVDVIAHIREPVPEELALVVGDWAHSLRSALDHAVYAHVDNPVAQKSCAFPVWRNDHSPTPEQWVKIVRKAVPGEQASALRAHIETLQPYRNGRDEFLWTLTELDNIDKHRVTIALAASIQATTHVTQGRFVSEEAAAAMGPDDGLLWQVGIDQPLSHPLFKNPAVSDFIADVRLEVVYEDPEPELVEDQGVIYTFSRLEWLDVIEVTPQFHFVLGDDPFSGWPLLAQIGSVTASVAALLDRLEEA